MFDIENKAIYYSFETPSPPGSSPFSDSESTPPSYMTTSYPHGHLIPPIISSDTDYTQSFASSPITQTTPNTSGTVQFVVPTIVTTGTTIDTNNPFIQDKGYKDSQIFPGQNLDQDSFNENSLSSFECNNSIVPSTHSRSNVLARDSDGDNYYSTIRRTSAPVNQLDECRQQSPQELDEDMEVEPETFQSETDTQNHLNTTVHDDNIIVKQQQQQQAMMGYPLFQNQYNQSGFYAQNAQPTYSYAFQPYQYQSSYHHHHHQQNYQQQSQDYYSTYMNVDHSDQPSPPAYNNGGRNML